MANHKKALLHHGKAATALAAGNYKEAAHHMGHALSALRQNAPADQPAPAPTTTTQADGTGAVASSWGGLRARLAKFKKAAPVPMGGDDGDGESGNG